MTKKKLEMKLIFCMPINIKISIKLISTLWASKFPTRWYYHYCWAWSSIGKVFKVTSLQYLYNISRNPVRNRVCFLHADKHESFYFYRSFTSKLWLFCSMEVTRYIQSTKNRKLVTFLQHIKKRVLQLLLCSIVMQNIQIVYGGPVMFIVTCFLAQPDCRNFLPQRSNAII